MPCLPQESMGLSGEQRGRILQARQTLLTQMGDILQRRREIIQSLQVAWLLGCMAILTSCWAT